MNLPRKAAGCSPWVGLSRPLLTFIPLCFVHQTARFFPPKQIRDFLEGIKLTHLTNTFQIYANLQFKQSVCDVPETRLVYIFIKIVIMGNFPSQFTLLFKLVRHDFQ